MKGVSLGPKEGDAGTIYPNRQEAGRSLVGALQHLAGSKPVVLGLARGGVVLAAEVAKVLHAPLDALICQKVGAPRHPEFGIGAVVSGGIRVADIGVLEHLGISSEEFEAMARMKMEEVDRRQQVYRANRPPPDLAGRTAIIVDDGLATGITAVAAVEYARRLGAAHIVLAAPVCSSSATSLLRNKVDELICLSEPSLFYAVGQWYRDFAQVSDETVIALLGDHDENAWGAARSVSIKVGDSTIRGDLTLTGQHTGVVVFAHGSGSGRLSPRNKRVADALNSAGFGTLLIDLLTEEEERVNMQTRHLRFDIPFLVGRLTSATAWLLHEREVPVGYFGASTGAAAALWASTQFPDAVKAIVSRGGRPDLAGKSLVHVKAPTLLIVGGHDQVVIELNEEALSHLGSEIKSIQIVPRATHLFEEPGALEEVSRLACDWFGRYLK